MQRTRGWLSSTSSCGEPSGSSAAPPILPAIRLKTRGEVDQMFTRTSTLFGVGKYGTVVKGKLKCDPRRSVAVKQIDIYAKGDRAEKEPLIFDKLRKFPTIVDVLDYYQRNGFLYIIMEPALGDLGQVLDKIRGHGIKDCYCAHILRHVLYALEFIHFNQIIHRDVCPSNILIFPSGLCKLGGFGEACRKSRRARGYYGTSTYMAPEVKFPKKDEWGRDRYYTEKIDIWSIGCVLYECLEGHPVPRIIQAELDTYSHFGVCHPIQLPNQKPYHTRVRHFLNVTLDIRPEMRYSAQELKYHSFINKQYVDNFHFNYEIANLLALENVPHAEKIIYNHNPNEVVISEEVTERTSVSPELQAQPEHDNFLDQLLCCCVTPRSS